MEQDEVEGRRESKRGEKKREKRGGREGNEISFFPPLAFSFSLPTEKMFDLVYREL